MAYQVDRYNGTFLVSVEDGTIDTTTDLRLLGKNYAGYGEVQNENFVHLLENFANSAPPPKALAGQIWYDATNKKIKFYDGSKFRTSGGSEVSASPPSGLSAGDFWLDTTTDQLYVYNGTSFVLVGPQIAEEAGATAVEVVVVKDVLNVNHTIIKFNVGADCQVIASKTAFALNGAVNPIAGFNEIRKGFTLINTPTTGVTTDDHYWWGTASNSLRLGGFLASEYLRNTNPLFPSGAKFFDIGFTLGDSDDIRFFIENGDQPILSNQLGSSGSQNITVRIQTSGGNRDYVFNQNAFFPGTNNLLDCGLNGARWANVYATTFRGSLVGNVTGNVTGNLTGNLTGDVTGNLIGNVVSPTGTAVITAGTTPGSAVFVGTVNGTATNALTLNSDPPDILPLPDTVALRDGVGALAATAFNGTATQANRLKIDNLALDTDPNYRSAKTTGTASTIVARDANGDIFCNVLNGTATSARYADLAEKYIPDADYDTGTVVMVGGEKEITAGQQGQRAIGVISKYPAFRMNMDLVGGVYVALKGRVPVKVEGAVKKGQRLVAGNGGCAVAAETHTNDVFAIALEDNGNTEVKLVEAVIL
jgi:hypothetical protein